MALPTASWRDEAACLGHIDLMFPVGTEMAFARMHEERRPKRDTATTIKAKALCARCPVAAECLEDAMALRPRDDWAGVRGGLLPLERYRLRKQLQDQRRREKVS